MGTAHSATLFGVFPLMSTIAQRTILGSPPILRILRVGTHVRQFANALNMMNARFNSLADWDNARRIVTPKLEIISVGIELDGRATASAIEILKTKIVDHTLQQVSDGIVGNNFSSYVRDYDFSVRLPEHNLGKRALSIPVIWDLHGKLFQDFVNSETYRENFHKRPVICLSVSNNKQYASIANRHPVLGRIPAERSFANRELL